MLGVPPEQDDYSWSGQDFGHVKTTEDNVHYDLQQIHSTLSVNIIHNGLSGWELCNAENTRRYDYVTVWQEIEGVQLGV